MVVKALRRLSQSCLSTGNDAYEFDAVAFSKWALWPFVSMHDEAVVLHQNQLRRQLIALDSSAIVFASRVSTDSPFTAIFMRCTEPDPNLSKLVRVLGGEGPQRFRRANVRR